MNVLFLSDVPIRNPTSGSERVLYHQARSFAAAGVGVTAITRMKGKGPIHYDNSEGVEEGRYYADTGDPIYFLLSVGRQPVKIYNRFITTNNFDAVISHQPYTCCTLLLRSGLKHIPIIYVFHSPSHEEYLLSNKKDSRWKKIFNAYLRKTIEGLCVKRAQSIITLSRYMADKVKTIHRIPIEKITVNPGGADLLDFRPKRERQHLKDGLNVPPGKIHLLTIRNLEPRMGLDNLIQAIRILKDKQAGCHLTIGGVGGEKENLENLVKKLKLDDAVTLVGFIQADDLADYYSAADYFILPTRRLEGFGLVTPEAMACGTPVLGTSVGGTQEILSNFKPEFLFDDTTPEAMAEGIAHAVGSYFYDMKRYTQLRLDCRKHIKDNYTWSRHVNQLKKTIAAVV